MRPLIPAILFLLAVATAVAPLAAEDVDDQAKARLTTGEQLLGAGALGAAEVELKKVIEDYPQTEWTHWARVRLSECYYHQNRFDACVLEARKVVNLYPTEAPQLAAAWAQFYVGLAHKGRKDLGSAIWEWQRVEQILGTSADRGPLLQTRCNLALAYHDRNDRKRAVAVSREILAEPELPSGDRAWAHVVLGSALVGDWRFDEGLAELQKARGEPALQEQMKAAERKIFDHKYIGRHDYDGAISEGRAIADDPATNDARGRQARYFVALACLYKKDYDAAIAEAQGLLDRYPVPGEDHCQCHLIKARAYAKKNDYAQAIDSLEAALATNPPDPEIRAAAEWDIATCYRVLGDMARAKERLQRIVDLYKVSHLWLRAAKELGN